MSISELKIPSLVLADAMGFITKGRGGPVFIEEGLKLNLVHVTAVPPWVTTMEETLSEIEKFKKMILQEQPRLKLVMNQKDLASAIKEQKVAVVLGMQNTPIDIIDNGIPKLKKAGIAVISPCYDGQNDFGSGWLNTDVGLTECGRLFLYRCAENNIMVDISHCGHKTARDIVSFRKKDEFKFHLMVSHTGCYSQYHHIRNLPDDVLKAVAELGGVVGITTLTFTNDEHDNSAFPFKTHLGHAIALCGADSVCVGSDDLYTARDIEETRKQFEIISKKLDPLGAQGARFPENPLAIMGPDMLEKLYKFCHPYFPVGIPEKIFGKNLLNFFQRALPA